MDGEHKKEQDLKKRVRLLSRVEAGGHTSLLSEWDLTG